MESLYDSVPLAQALLCGGSPMEQKPAARHLPYYFPTTFPSSYSAPPAKRPRLSPEVTPSLDDEDESEEEGSTSSDYPGVPLAEWLAREDAREKAEDLRRAREELQLTREEFSSSPEPAPTRKSRKEQEEEEEWNERQASTKAPKNRRSPGTPTVEDALAFFTSGGKATPQSSATATSGSETSACGASYTPNVAKPFRCPTPGCSAAYKQQNGLKYHRLHGKCKIGAVDLVDSEPEKRFRCHESECGKKYKNMNGLRYHYQHSGVHGIRGLEMVHKGTHPPFPRSTAVQDRAASQEKEATKPSASPKAALASSTSAFPAMAVPTPAPAPTSEMKLSLRIPARRHDPSARESP